MKIPIKNLYYLFLYAWARFPEGPLAEIGIDDGCDLPNLFAKLLCDGTKRIVRRGLDRDYHTFTDEVVSPRGRLRIDRIIKEGTRLRGTAICDFDDLTHDVLANQILKTTLTSLARCEDVDNANRHELELLVRKLHDVTEIRLSVGHFRATAVSSKNREYFFVMQLCEFVFWSLMPDEQGAGAKFKQILENEARMAKIFEDFLRNFCKLRRSEYRVRAESSEWDVKDATQDGLALLPRMLTDITLRHPNHTVIVDAKFYKEGALVRSQHGERVRSQHLYQLITYLQHERVRHQEKALSGMLIYPDVGRSLRLPYRLLDIPIVVATVNLGKEWREIEEELHGLLNDCAAVARLASEQTRGSAEKVVSAELIENL